MRVLITGGCGFIGSNFIRFFVKKYPRHEILNIDKLTYAGNLENLSGLEKNRNYGFVKADITNATQMRKVFKRFRPDAVINFAAESHVDRSITSPDAFLKTNFLGVGVLLNCALHYGVTRFVQISTDEVYGSIARGKFREDSVLNPSSPYSASKAAADGLVMAYYRTYGLPVVITRSSNNYGPYQFPEKFIPLVIFNAMNGKKIPVYGDGLQVRDWIYVEDNCRAIDLVVRKGKLGEIYNVGGQHERANIEIIKQILKTLGKPLALIEHVKDRPGHDRRYALSISKIKRQLGWQPCVSFQSGFEKTMRWYRKNGEWLKNTQTGAYRSFYRKYYSTLGLTET
ncbi:MAG: dTDP-glucose 4,6-dehydratase [candidate division WOR-3 bacterium]|nr:MAG: dTDP-glucose 4,6-dehydratase [candidate division WOR-3 bacterium]